MDKIPLPRRSEIEEMEQDIMESATHATNYERYMKSLKIKPEDQKLRHK